VLRVMVVDGLPVVRRGIVAAAPEGGAMVVAEAGTVEEARVLAARTQPQVIVIDYRLPDMLAPEALPALRAAAPEARVVLFTVERIPAVLEAAAGAGFDGCLLKDIPLADLFVGLHQVVAGTPVFDPRLLGRQGAPAPDDESKSLTRREYEVLRRVAMGETNLEIAQAIGLSPNTVKTYLQAALHKLGARNRVEALARASEKGLL
jgi:two-component system nitrate/nitrite response regulator NarL